MLAQRTGCNGLMVLPSMVYQQDQREGVAHFRAIANAVDLPIMIYNNPVSYKLDLTPESFLELSEIENGIPILELREIEMSTSLIYTRSSFVRS